MQQLVLPSFHFLYICTLSQEQKLKASSASLVAMKSAFHADPIANKKQTVTVNAHPTAPLRAHCCRSNGLLSSPPLWICHSRICHSRLKAVNHLCSTNTCTSMNVVFIAKVIGQHYGKNFPERSRGKS